MHTVWFYAEIVPRVLVFTVLFLLVLIMNKMSSLEIFPVHADIGKNLARPPQQDTVFC